MKIKRRKNGKLIIKLQTKDKFSYDFNLWDIEEYLFEECDFKFLEFDDTAMFFIDEKTDLVYEIPPAFSDIWGIHRFVEELIRLYKTRRRYVFIPLSEVEGRNVLEFYEEMIKTQSKLEQDIHEHELKNR